MSIKTEKDDKVVSNTTKDCNICSNKFMKIAKIHYSLHSEENYKNCAKCKQLFKEVDVEHFQEHYEELYMTSLFPCNICKPKFNTIMKEYSIAVLFKKGEDHQNENINTFPKCIQNNLEVFSIHFNKHCEHDPSFESDQIFSSKGKLKILKRYP